MQIYKEILSNIKDLKNSSQVHSERVFLTSDDLLKKVIVATSDHGNEIGIQIPENKSLKDGDIIFNDGHNIIYICLETTDVLIIKPKNINEMGIVAHNLGNRHMPAQFHGDHMYVPYDYLVEDYLKEQGVEYAREHIKLETAFRHVDGAH